MKIKYRADKNLNYVIKLTNLQFELLRKELGLVYDEDLLDDVLSDFTDCRDDLLERLTRFMPDR